MWNRLLLCAATSACLLPAGCQRAPERRFDLKGKVVAVDQAGKQVTLAHEKIPGFMEAMTMPFNVADDWALSVLAPGQEVEATLVVKEDRSWIENLRISKAEEVKGSAVSSPGPKPGDEVPDFSLVSQDNQRIHIHQYRGRPLLLTFIYTRCPIPDYCPRTSSHFSEIHRSLKSVADPGKRPHLLTISFDTEHDSPAVLRKYAARYMNPVSFQDWEFATGSADEIKKITGYFGLTYQPEFGQITHSLVTALIGPDGGIKRIYPGNQWTARQILAGLR